MDKRARSILGAGLCAACGVGLLLVGSTLMGVLACLGGTGMLVYTLKQPS
jgi:hypothetical protein